MDTETNGNINDDEEENMDGLKSTPEKKSHRRKRSKKSNQDQAEVIDDMNKKRIGTVAGVKRHDDFTSKDDSKQGHYEKLVHYGDEDDERYAKLSKFSNDEQRSLDDDERIDKSKISKLLNRFSESEDSDDASDVKKADETLDSNFDLDYKFEDFRPEERGKDNDCRVNETLQILVREPDVTLLDKNVVLLEEQFNEVPTEKTEDEPLRYDAQKTSVEFYSEKVPQSFASVHAGRQDYFLDEMQAEEERPDLNTFENNEYKASDPTDFDYERREASAEITKRDSLQYKDVITVEFQGVSIPEDLHARKSPVYDMTELEDEKIKFVNIISDYDFKNSTEECRADVTEYENNNMQPSHETRSCRVEQCQQTKSVYVDSTTFDEPQLLQTFETDITQDVPVVVFDETQVIRNADSDSGELGARTVDVKFSPSYARELSDHSEENNSQQFEQDPTESDEGIDTVDREFQLKKDQDERLSDDLENLESEDDMYCEDKIKSKTLETTTRVDDNKVDVIPLSSECMRDLSKECYQTRAAESVIEIEEELIIPECKTKVKEEESFPMDTYGEYRQDEKRFKPNDDNEFENEGTNIQQEHKSLPADQCQQSKSIYLDPTTFEELQLMPNIKTIVYHDAPAVEVTVQPSNKLEELDQGEKADDHKFGGRNKFFGSADTESSDSDIELDESSRRQYYTGNVMTFQDEIDRCKGDCRNSPPFDMLQQDERVNTISPDSAGDFRDLKEEYSQKYFQGSINPDEIEVSGDPVDKLLYCYNSSKVCGNSVFYDYDSSTAEQDLSISFMPDFDIYEPSIDHHENKVPQKVDRNKNPEKTIEFKFLDDNSRLYMLKTLFSEDDPRSIDYDRFELGLPEPVRASIEDLPDGYVVSRQSTLDARRGHFGGDVDATLSNEGHSARHSGSGNVFEQIPGADGKRNLEEDF